MPTMSSASPAGILDLPGSLVSVPFALIFFSVTMRDSCLNRVVQSFDVVDEYYVCFYILSTGLDGFILVLHGNHHAPIAIPDGFLGGLADVLRKLIRAARLNRPVGGGHGRLNVTGRL